MAQRWRKLAERGTDDRFLVRITVIEGVSNSRAADEHDSGYNYH
jgi:hypothetical protein